METIIFTDPVVGSRIGQHRETVAFRCRPESIGEQQEHLALLACRSPQPPIGPTAAPAFSGLGCLHCGSEMLLLERLDLGTSVRLSAECPRCRCLRATVIELTAEGRFVDFPQEASFD
ncbi:MAG TPA: hypothetical protein VK449_07705 [Anaerolineales bacterium]|nr:hypothetical protein [Anaerolineales bacterium]